MNMDFLKLCQDSVIKLAEDKLGRPLTEQEVYGIRNIHSPMMLEAYEREFDWHETTTEQIQAALDYCAKQTIPFKL